MKNKSFINVGRAHAFNGEKLIVIESDGTTNVYPISKHVGDALVKAGIPAQG